MGAIRPPLPAKIFLGMLSSEPDLFSECTAIFTQAYGAVDLESDVLPWTTSDYYDEEMGTAIFRKFIFFQKPVDPSLLVALKRFSNSVETRFSSHEGRPKRRINLDPGYVTEAKVVLASTKDFAHRVYIGDGIYGEVTLRFAGRERTFAALEHTYFDFREQRYRELFNQARELLRISLER